MTIATCHVCGEPTPHNPPSGVCSVECLNRGQGFAAPAAPAMTLTITRPNRDPETHTVTDTDAASALLWSLARPLTPGWIGAQYTVTDGDTVYRPVDATLGVWTTE